MGICSSCEPNKEESMASKAKVVLENGKLVVFSCPIRVSQISNRNPCCFICNADDMNFDDYLLAIKGDEELELGQLYFELPEDLLKTRLTPNQMASLAVKASLALNDNNCGDKRHSCYGCGLTKRLHAWEDSKRDDEASPIMASGWLLNRMRSGRGRKISRKLSAILEDDQ